MFANKRFRCQQNLVRNYYYFLVKQFEHSMSVCVWSIDMAVQNDKKRNSKAIIEFITLISLTFVKTSE
jgi:hypothetical protein